MRFDLSEQTHQFEAKGKVDREAGIVHDVKILGLRSPTHRREYTNEALKSAVPMYEGAKVNLNHPDPQKPNQSRSVMDRFGKFQNVKFKEGDGLYGELHYNTEHSFAAPFAFFAEKMPDAIGPSHNAVGRGRRTGSMTIIEGITSLKSIDIVADPGTVSSLFESQGEDTDEWDIDQMKEIIKKLSESKQQGGSEEMTLLEAQLNDLSEQRPDLIKSIRDTILVEIKESAETKAAADELVKLKEERDQLKKTNDEFQVKEAIGAKRVKVDEILKESGLPKEAITDHFIGQLVEAEDDKAMQAAIDDRKAVIGYGKPKSREQNIQESINDGSHEPAAYDTVVHQLTGKRVKTA